MCKLCNINFEGNNRRLSKHLQDYHKITSKEYYDLFFKKEVDGFCKKCRAPTRFKNISIGYCMYCSKECSCGDSARTNKILQTKNKLYGKGHRNIYIKQQETRSNWSEERKKEYYSLVSKGVSNAYKKDTSLSFRIYNTKKENLVEISKNIKEGHAKRSKEQIEISNLKRKQSSKIKYGVESHTQLKSYKEARKLWWDSKPLEDKSEIIARIISSKIESGYMLPSDHPERINKKKYKGIVRQISNYWAVIKFDKEEQLKRALNGTSGGLQLDHIVSLETCYRQGIPAEVAGHHSNLRLISWQENIKKSKKDDMSIIELWENFKKNENSYV